jgi:hypothetical protein
VTREQLKAKYPNASESFLKANCDLVGSASPRPKPEPPVRHEPVAEKAREAGDTSRFHVRVVSFRRKLCDPDNLCPKYFIDCLRYAEIIPDDRPQDITLEVRQEKVKRKEDERTDIEITPI